jgi:TolA-binding protein
VFCKISVLLLSLLITVAVICHTSFAATGALKNIRFGHHNGVLRVVLDFEGQPPRCQVSTNRDGAVYIVIPMVRVDRIQTLLANVRSHYPSEISTIMTFFDNGNTTIKINMNRGVSLTDHGVVNHPARLYMDLKKTSSSENSVPPIKENSNKPTNAAPAARHPSDQVTPVRKTELIPSPEHEPASNIKAGSHLSAQNAQMNLKKPAPEPQSDVVINDGSYGSAQKTQIIPQEPVPFHSKPILNQDPPGERQSSITKKIDASNQGSPKNMSDEVLINDAYKCFEKKDFSGAFELVHELTRQFPQSSFLDRAMYLRADCLYELKRNAPISDRQQVVDAYADALSHYPESGQAASASLKMGIAYLEMGFSYEALSQFKLVESTFPGTKQADEISYWVAETKFQMGKYEEASQLLTRFIHDKPESSVIKRATIRVVECYSRLKRQAEADQILSEALQKWPNLAIELPLDSITTIAEQMKRQGQVPVAEEMLLLGINMYPEDERASKLLWQLAQTYAAQGNQNRAGAAYYLLMDRYAETDEGMQARLELADLAIKRIPLDSLAGKSEPYRNPQETYRILAADGPPKVREEALYRLALNYDQNGELEKSLSCYRQLAIDFPSSVYSSQVQHAAEVLLKKYLETINPEKSSFAAIKLYETGFLSAGWKLEDPASLLKLGKCYAHLDLLKEAVEACRNALNKSGMDNELQCHILEQGAYWQSQIGHTEQACEWLSRYLQQEAPKQVDSVHVLTLARWKYVQKHYQEAANLYLSLLPATDSPSVDQKTSELAAKASAELGRINLETDHPVDAANYLIRAMKLYSGNKSQGKGTEFLGECHLLLADAYFSQASFPQAHEHYLESLKSTLNDQNLAWALYRVALLEPKIGGIDLKGSPSARLREVKNPPIWSQIGEAVLRNNEIKEQSSQIL